MRAVIQRVKQASVTVGEKTVGFIGPGLLVLLGVAKGDAPADADFLAGKLAELRIFEDDQGKMNRSINEAGPKGKPGEFLVVSQFTLLGDCRKGRRPSFDAAADPNLGEELYELFVAKLRSTGLNVATGQFRAMMEVQLINDGPVTFVIDSRD